ncbi:bromodomain and PHD finger-containing protein 1 [Nematocida sp. AWRm80]|nr:bromodomain and PHD finger-containing protein 1 [Nematocida sp. AWRm80]
MPNTLEKSKIMDSLCLEEENNPGKIEYNMDEADLEILEYLKEKHPWATEDEYELVLDRLEKEHFCIQQTAIKRLPEPDNLPDECNICGEEETTNENFLVFCDSCNLGVHQNCYGVPNIPEGSWLCRPCFLSPKKAPTCVLCPSLGGAFKRTTTGAWCHVICAHLVPGVNIENASLVEPIDTEEAHRNSHQCGVCESKKGAQVPCAYEGCRRHYHGTCAVKNKYYIDLANGIIYCTEHDPRTKIESNAFFMDTPDMKYPVLEHVPQIRPPVQLWMPQLGMQTVIEKLEPQILHRTVNNIAYRDLHGIQGATAFVKDMYPVWIAKRKQKPLIKRLRLDLALNETLGYNTLTSEIDISKSIPEQKLSQAYKLLPERLALGKSQKQMLALLMITSRTLREEQKRVSALRMQVQNSIFALEHNKNRILTKCVPEYQSMITLLDELEAADKHGFFKEQVTDEIAAGYSSVISNPQWLDGIRDKVNSLKYTTMQGVIKDIQILISNAYKYNRKESFVGVEAQVLEQILNRWKIKQNDIILARVLPYPYLPYIVISPQVPVIKDSILAESLLTQEQMLVERSSIRLIAPAETHQSMLNQLNTLTGISPEQERQQEIALNNLSEHLRGQRNR